MNHWTGCFISEGKSTKYFTTYRMEDVKMGALLSYQKLVDKVIKYSPLNILIDKTMSNNCQDFIS